MTGEDRRPAAVVTGAAGGLGGVITRTLLADGFRVAALDLDVSAAEAAFAPERADGALLAIEVDVTSEARIADAIAEIAASWGRADVLVNNAGVELNHTISDFEQSTWDATFAVNVRGPATLVKHLVPLWREQHSGSVIFIGSRTWHSGSANVAYASSKAALVGLARSLAAELGPLGVRSNVIAPSFVRTPLNARKGDAFFVEAYAERFAAATPLGRLIEPQDVADLVGFLASDRSRSITGEVIAVAGGAQLPPTVR